MSSTQPAPVDFTNTELAFRHLSDRELKRRAWVYSMMNRPWLVRLGSSLALWGVKAGLPGVAALAKNTLFDQFIGGETLLDSLPTIEALNRYQVSCILNYGVEASEDESSLNKGMNEIIRAIEFASQNKGILGVSIKLTSLGRILLFEQLQERAPQTDAVRQEYESLLKRIDAICSIAARENVALLLDAEESWIQDPMDHLATLMMQRYNKQKVIIYNTFQLYRTDRLQFLMDAHQHAVDNGYLLGAKIVRGAYMQKERARAKQKGYPSPIQPTKEATDDAYNMALRFCVNNRAHIKTFVSTHNTKSNLLMTQLMQEQSIPPGEPALLSCQLYGMSDNITYPLAHAGYNAVKFLPYAPAEDVIPYLIRRAQENTSVTGEAGRELSILRQEIQRRKSARR